MKNVMYRCSLMIAAFLFIAQLSFGQKTNVNKSSNEKTKVMKTYVIERNLPGAGKLTPEDLKDISAKSCDVLKKLGPSIVWLHSYVTGDKLYCVYQSENEELIRKHAELGEFPCNSVKEITAVISPETAK